MGPKSKRNWAGVWIDQAKAVVVVPRELGVEVVTIFSEMEPKHRSTGGRSKSKPYMHEGGPFSAQHHEHHESQKLKGFFNRVVDVLGVEAEDVLILGSGRAPIELQKHLEPLAQSKTLRVTVEKSKELSTNQLQHKIREHFGWPAPRKLPELPGQPSVAW